MESPGESLKLADLPESIINFILRHIYDAEALILVSHALELANVGSCFDEPWVMNYPGAQVGNIVRTSHQATNALFSDLGKVP